MIDVKEDGIMNEEEIQMVFNECWTCYPGEREECKNCKMLKSKEGVESLLSSIQVEDVRWNGSLEKLRKIWQDTLIFGPDYVNELLEQGRYD